MITYGALGQKQKHRNFAQRRRRYSTQTTTGLMTQIFLGNFQILKKKNLGK